MPILTFAEETHQYKLDGVAIPSVTQIMEPLSRAKYKAIDESILKAAAKRGSEVHEAIEFYTKYGIMECPHEAEPYVNAYMKWAQQYKPQTIQTEQATWHKQLMYAGTIDNLSVIDGRKTLIDYKTTAELNDMLTSVQLEAYSQALKSQGVDVEQKAILHLCKGGTYHFKVYPLHDVEAWKTFGALLTIGTHIKKYGG